MNKWKKFTAACMGAAMVGTTVFGSSAVFADDTVTLDVWHQFTDPESAQTSAFEAAVKEYENMKKNMTILKSNFMVWIQSPIKQKSLQSSQAVLPV